LRCQPADGGRLLAEGIAASQNASDPVIEATADDSPGIKDRLVVLALAGVTAAATLAALWTTKSVDPIRSDTASYLYFEPTRTIGYPAFLELVRLATGRVALAAPLQTLLLGGSLFLLGWAFHNFIRRPAWSFAFQALLLASPLMWKTSASLLTEALSTACVALWCAQLLRMFRRETLNGVTLLVAISAIATVIRPSMVALFLATALFAFLRLRDGDRWRGLVLSGIGLALAWIVTPLAFHLINPAATATSPFARGILQHSLFCTPPTVGADPEAQFVEREAAPARQYVESAPFGIRPALRRFYSAQLRFGLIIPAIGRERGFDAGWQTDPIVSRIAWQRLGTNPLCYVGSVLAAHYRMATNQITLTPGEARETREFIATHPPIDVPVVAPLPYEQRIAKQAMAEIHGAGTAELPDRELSVPDKSPAILVWAGRILYSAAASLGLLALLVLFRRSSAEDETAVCAATIAVAFHGIIGITAIVELGLSRYSIPVWPLVCVMPAIVAIALSRQAARRPIITPAEPALQT
jgi:hypothetical protein